MKKILALSLAVLMVVSCIPCSFAASVSETGSFMYHERFEEENLPLNLRIQGKDDGNLFEMVRDKCGSHLQVTSAALGFPQVFFDLNGKADMFVMSARIKILEISSDINIIITDREVIIPAFCFWIPTVK